MQLTERELKLVRRENLQWIFIAQGVAILPLLIHLPVWLWVVWVLALVWRIQIFRERLPFPSSVTKFVIGIGGVAGLVASYAGKVSIEPMVGFLVCSFVLKLLELRTQKDALLIIYIGFIAVAAQFLFSQTILTSLYGIISCVMLITAWQTVYYSRYCPTKQKLKEGGLLVLQSLPLMLVLFLVMPRIGPLWSVPLPDASGKTGFSDTLSPGDLGRLVKSEGVAFRVSFDEAAPSPAQLYWRGLVLDHFDGRTWSLNDRWQSRSAIPLSVPEGETISYSVTVEPHHHEWLFTLMPVVSARSAQLKTHVTSEYLLAAGKPLSKRSQYKVVSATSHIFTVRPYGLQSYEYRENTQLPPSGNEQARQTAMKWVIKGLTPKQIVDEALSLFNSEFYYTLQPPRLGDNSVDEFLFNTKRGFCEHFASSFSYLMRAAGVPARVVVGYQGGKFSEVDDYIIVSQADAHAWAEVWIDGDGWVRVDPTAAVAPSRIEVGLEEALSEDERDLVGAGSWDNALFGKAQQYWDAMGYSWHRWVLGYDKDSQSSVFSRLLGGTDYWRVGLALFICGIVIIGGYALRIMMTRNRPYLTPEALLYQVFEKKVQRHSLARRPYESAASFSKRVGQILPQYKVGAIKIAQLHDEVAYGGKPDRLPLLKRYVKAFPVMP